MKYEVAGDPVSGLRWTRKTTKKIAAELSALGIRVSRKTVAKLLKQMNFSLRTNKKKISNGSPPTRDAQFANITQLRERFSRRGNPILSVDTKKKELVGRFKNPGRVWAQKSDAVNDHDFRSMADGVAIPYGIYDLQSNRGTVYVGTSYDTSQFAVECIEKWWRSEGQKRFPGRKHLLVVADTGGSNGATRRAWKHGIQHKLCNEHGLDVTVAHYPPGASKWNPIEHRLFSEISKNWAGRPLDSYETILNFIRTTKTKTGLKVNARLVKKQYPKGIKISVCWFSVKMTARLDVNATPGVRMSPLAPGIVPECSGASRVKRAARAGFAALDSPCALWYSLVVGERERSGAPGIRVFMRAPCYYAAHAAPLVPAPVSGPAPTRSLGPCQP